MCQVAFSLQSPFCMQGYRRPGRLNSHSDRMQQRSPSGGSKGRFPLSTNRVNGPS